MKRSIMRPVLVLLPLITLAHALTFTLDPQADPLFVVSDKFLSVALDISNIEGRFADFNLTDPYLAKLVKHLWPVHFRIGGTYADRTVFSNDLVNKKSQSSNTVGLANITFLASDWLKVYEFARNAEVSLIYDLNSLLRNEDGSWNSENAEQMIQFSSDNRMTVDWELGNEPDLYNSIYGTQVNATQLALDYQKFWDILNQFDLYRNAYRIGIDMFDVGGSQSNQDYLRTFLREASYTIHAITWHQYYFAGKDATEDLFLNPSTFNYLEQRTNVVTNIVNNLGLANKVWLGETSSAYNGGAANMSNRFIGTFLWIDKLGLGARLGLDVIIRQTFFHDNYALIDNDYVPNPDWWLSVLYKRLVGTSVLYLTNNGTTANTVRLYAHCAKFNPLMWDDPAVVVFGFNVANETASVSLEGFKTNSTVYAYELTYESSLYSQGVRLNGDVLALSSEGELPGLRPKIVQQPNNIYSIPAYSIVFWVFSNSTVTACIH